MKNKLILGAVVIGLLLNGVSVKADQIFLFSDDLSTQFDIDLSQTAAKFVPGMFYTADDSVSSAVTSKIVANPFRTIVSARLDMSVFVPSNANVIYYLSNNNGSRWTQVNPGFTYTLDSVGNELRWRAVIARESPFVASAYIDNVHITYTVSDSVTPSLSTGLNNGSLNTVVYGSGGDLNSFVCDALSSIGLGCGAPQKIAAPTYGTSGTSGAISQPASIPATAATAVSEEHPSRQSARTGSLQASIANVTVKRTASDDDVILVKVPAKNDIRPTLGLNTNDAIFEIIKGQKHFIPTVDIFFDYDFDLDAVQSVTHKDLEPFPRAKLVSVHNDRKINYYVTEGHMIRLIPNKLVFTSYGDREEDIITVSKKEFNFYPRNQFVFLENPLGTDIFQIVNDGTKRYVVPQVTKRLRIKPEQIAPINQVQLDAYSNGSPIIF